MPTRIVLDAYKEETPTSPATATRRGLFAFDEDPNAFDRRSITFFNNATSQIGNSNGGSLIAPPTPPAHRRKIVQFRSSILRQKVPEANEQKETTLSSADIRASPRLIGYLYQLLASTILLITVVKFYYNSQNETVLNIEFENIFAPEFRIIKTVNGPVYFWKLVGCAIAGACGAGISLLIVLAHVDTIIFPRLWYAIFRDGSKYEQNLLRLILIFWIVSLHVCTSALSVGQILGNVYFTCWIAFMAAVLNSGVWRESAGFPSIAEKISLHKRATTLNWLWSFFFFVTFALAATDIFYERSELTIVHKGEVLDLTSDDWYRILGFVWSFSVLCIVALIFNHGLEKGCEIRVFKSRLILGWRQTEGLVIFCMLGVFFWIIYEHTGVDGVLIGYPNAYFGAWGSFFNCIFLLGTWLRENKNIEYIIASDEGKKRRVYNA